MSFDLLLTGGHLSDGARADVGISADRIAAMAPRLEAEAGETIDVSDCLLAPPFVDPHFHMDATLSYGLPRINASGTLLEGIALWGELKPILTHNAVVDRALAYCDWAVSMGLLAIRSHVDVCDNRLLGVEALLEVREKVRPYLDLQLVAFPQDGFYRDPTARANTLRALDMGVDVVGGIPHFERTMADGLRSVTELCEIAASPSTSTATRPTTPCRATSNSSPSRPSASASRAARAAATSPRCIRWTTTTSRNSCP